MTVTTRPARPTRPARSRLRVRTMPGRIRLFAVLAVLTVAGLFTAGTFAFDDARDGLRVIGHGAGPQVVATGDLYYALSDMDANLAGALLTGSGDPGRRAAALKVYDQRLTQANTALLQASRLAGSDTTEQTTARSMLDALGRYERFAGQALLLDQRANHPAGPPPANVLAIYRQATDLMKLDVLPKAYNLTLDNGSIVRKTYETKRSAVLTGRIWVGLTGLLVVVVLAGVQLYLTRRFRRLVNPFLALATIGTLVLVIVMTTRLSHEAKTLKTAKQDGFDSVLALSRARAISNSANADETRYLLDPGRADTYEQVYLDKSQAIVYVPAGNLQTYYQQLDAKIGGTSFLGFFGAEAKHNTLRGQDLALRGTLTAYQKVQHDDRQIRQLTAAGNRAAALPVKTGASADDFADYDRHVVALTALHRAAFDQAIKKGDDALSGWDVGLPAAAVVLVLLILAGVRPRLSEYR